MMVTKAHVSTIADVRSRFVLRGSSLRAWCIHNGVDPGYAHKALTGRNTGPGALKLRSRIIAEATKEPGRG